MKEVDEDEEENKGKEAKKKMQRKANKQGRRK